MNLAAIFPENFQFLVKKITKMSNFTINAHDKKPLDFLRLKKFFFPIKKNLVALGKLKTRFKVGAVDFFFEIFQQFAFRHNNQRNRQKTSFSTINNNFRILKSASFCVFENWIIRTFEFQKLLKFT